MVERLSWHFEVTMSRNQAPVKTVVYILYSEKFSNTKQARILSVSCCIENISSPSQLVVKLPEEESTHTAALTFKHHLLCTLTSRVSLLKQPFFPLSRKKTKPQRSERSPSSSAAYRPAADFRHACGIRTLSSVREVTTVNLKVEPPDCCCCCCCTFLIQRFVSSGRVSPWSSFYVDGEKVSQLRKHAAGLSVCPSVRQSVCV